MDDPSRAPPPPPSGWLAPTDAFWRSLLALPELALVAESCAGESRLHHALVAEPARAIDAAELAAVTDDDARDNYATFLAYRDALLAAGTLEAHYLALMRGGRIAVPPVFLTATLEAIVEHLLDATADAFERRAAQLFYREQRITLSDGRVLAADREIIDALGASGADVIGPLIRPEGAHADARTLPVLGADNAGAFGTGSAAHRFVFDLTHEVASELGHGLVFTMTRADSGIGALARVLERWVAHFFGVAATIRPLQRIDDPAWSWHIGLDVDSSAMLDDLYRGAALDDARARRLLALFRLDVANAHEMRADLAGKPVYLGLAMTVAGTLKLKPQNLLVNLPLATPS